MSSRKVKHSGDPDERLALLLDTETNGPMKPELAQAVQDLADLAHEFR